MRTQKDWNSCPLVDTSSAQPLELPPQPYISTAYKTDPSARIWFYCQVVKFNWFWLRQLLLLCLFLLHLLSSHSDIFHLYDLPFNCPTNLLNSTSLICGGRENGNAKIAASRKTSINCSDAINLSKVLTKMPKTGSYLNWPLERKI